MWGIQGISPKQASELSVELNIASLVTSLMPGPEAPEAQVVV